MIQHRDKWRKDLGARTKRARSYHDLWMAIGGVALRSNYLQRMNDFEAVFRTTETATRLAFVVTLCSLYDNTRGTVTIERYAEDVWQRTTARTDWISRFQEAKAIARRLYTLRNNYFAHSSQVTFKRDLFQETGLTYNALSGLMSETWELVKDVISADGGRILYSDTLTSNLCDLFPMIELPLAWGSVVGQK